jgi:DNA-binding NarL/FixJ family response regulator
MTIRIALADDHPLILDGLLRLFEREDDIDVVACCSDGEEVLQAVRAHHPDVLIVDLRMPRVGGLKLLRQLFEEGCRMQVVVFTAELADEDLLEAVRLGARGLVLKDMAPDLLVRCVRTVHAGGQWLEKQAAGRALERLALREVGWQTLARVLSRREIELVRFVAQGLRNKEIAARLSISEGTVKIHLHNIYGKLGVGNRVELANYARKRGLD